MTKAPKHAKYIVEDYEPVFDRLSNTRRVLGFVTPEVDTDGLGPRNTLPAIAYAVIRDDNTGIQDPDGVEGELDGLVSEGLLVKDKGGIYTVTKAGWTELMN